MPIAAPALSDDGLVELLSLIEGADSVELKLTIPESSQRSAFQALGMDPLGAQVRLVYFFDTPDLTLESHGVVVRARRVAKRLDRLSESYWELRYEYGQLRSQLARLESPGSDSEAGSAPQRQEAGGSTVFVPLSSLKR